MKFDKGKIVKRLKETKRVLQKALQEAILLEEKILQEEIDRKNAYFKNALEKNEKILIDIKNKLETHKEYYKDDGQGGITTSFEHENLFNLHSSCYSVSKKSTTIRQNIQRIDEVLKQLDLVDGSISLKEFNLNWRNISEFL